MKNTFAHKSTALLLLAALTACSGGAAGGGGVGNGAGPSNPLPAGARRSVRPERGTGILQRIVGVGDSLTAGYQSGGFLGATGVRNPLDPVPPANIVPPGQESGWWADLYEQATGFPVAGMYDPAVSPLPLIAGPGLDNQVVPALKTTIGLLKPGDSCTDYNGFDQSGFGLRDLHVVRMNPYSTTVRDVAVPGITLHEAITMSQPLTATCQPIPGTPGLLSAIVNGESGTFWPVLGNFANLGSNLTMTNAAASLHPTLATVWLGANDVLKFMGTGGRFTGIDSTPGQVESDERATISILVHAGAHVVVANLPDVLETPYFMRVSIPSNLNVCNVQTYVYCLLLNFNFPQPLAAQLTKQLASQYRLATPGGCTPISVSRPCGYVTLQGALAALAGYLATGKLPNLDPSGPGSGLGGHYITPSLAARIQVLNNNVNAGIDAAAQATYVPLVDVKSAFDGIASGNLANPYFRQAASINPGICCTLTFLGGLVSFDGLHPSNTGYAVLATIFIQTINTAYATHIPQVNVRKIYRGAAPYPFPDPYAPQLVGDLKMVRNGHGGIMLRYLRRR